MLEDDAPQRIRSCFTSPQKILPNKNKSLSLSLGLQIFRIRFPLSDIHRIAYTSETLPSVTTKATVIRLDRFSFPHPPSVRTLAARQRMLKSIPPLTIFQTSISSKTLYPHPLQSNLGQPWSEPIKSWASMERANQNAPFRLTDPARPRPWRQRET